MYKEIVICTTLYNILIFLGYKQQQNRETGSLGNKQPFAKFSHMFHESACCQLQNTCWECGESHSWQTLSG